MKAHLVTIGPWAVLEFCIIMQDWRSFTTKRWRHIIMRFSRFLNSYIKLAVLSNIINYASTALTIMPQSEC